MAETNERVMAMVEQELRANPDMSNEDLRARAEKLDDAIARMSARQFNATYPLQVKRRLTPGGPRGGRKAAKGGRGRKAGAKRVSSAKRAGATKRRGRPAAAKRGAKRGRAAAEAGGATIRGGGGGRGGRGGSSAGSDGARGRVRAALLDFARDLASADGAGLVDVIAGVDGYVDRVLKATGGR